MTLAISATDTELQKPVNVIFKETLLRNAMARAPYFAGTQQGEIQLQQGTSTCKWRRIENMAPSTTSLSELTGNASYGMGRASVAASFTDITATLAKFGQYYLINEEVQLFNFSGTEDKLVETLGIAAGRSANRLQRNVADDSLTAIYANGAASEGVVNSVPTSKDMANAVVTLDTNVAETFAPMTLGDVNQGTAPIQMAYWGLCHPHAAYDWSKVPGFIPVQSYAGQTQTMLGEFGAINVGTGQAVRMVSSQDADVNLAAGNSTVPAGIRGSSAVDTYTTVVYGRDCLGSVGFGVQWTDGIYRAGADLNPIDLLLSERRASPADPFAEVQSLAYKFWWAGAVLNGAWGRAIIHGATDLS